MNKKNMEIYYDSEADILEIFTGEPAPSYFNEIDDDIFEGRDRKTGELKGYKIFNLTKRKGNEWLKNIKIPLPTNLKVKD